MSRVQMSITSWPQGPALPTLLLLNALHSKQHFLPMWTPAVPSFTWQRTWAIIAGTNSSPYEQTGAYSHRSIRVSSEKPLCSQGGHNSCIHIRGGSRHHLLADWREMSARPQRWWVGVVHLMLRGGMEGIRVCWHGGGMSQGSPNCRCSLSYRQLPTSSQKFTGMSCFKKSCFDPCHKRQKGHIAAWEIMFAHKE